ncbi:MAG: acyl-CoA dehydrogenase family protein, partial [Thermoleophilaceae bacterium]
MRAVLSEPPVAARLEEAALLIAAGAEERDRLPAFPTDALDVLERAGALALTVPDAAGERPVSFAEEWAAVRRVACADGSVGRIYDGHMNAVERLDAHAREPLRSEELAAVAAGRRRLGVWGADPVPGEGEPARLVERGDRRTIEGVKVFCSGAGGLDRALVLVRGDRPGPPLLAYVDLTERVRVDRAWYRGAGMRASESHRVVFDEAEVLAVLGDPGELAREPWLGRDAVRTAATWAGVADSGLEAALAALAIHLETDELRALAAG